MNPIVDVASTLRKYPVDARYYPRALLYFLKLGVWEPFRYAERAVARLRSEPKPLPHAPVIILGYYRSGTTHLQETLLQDPQFGYMNFYQCFFPTAFSSTESWVKPIFERIVTRMGMLHPAHQIPFSFQLPAEEDVSMVASGSRLAANWGQVLPRHFKEIYSKTGLMEGLTDAELAAWKHELHDLLWRVSKANGHKRLLLKSPPQLGRLSVLLDMYPDAKFIFIRRNPYDVFASNKKLWKSFDKTWLQDVDAATVREYILWSHERCHRAYDRDKVLLRSGQLCEVTFEAFQADPIGTVRRIYETLNLSEFSRVEPLFASYLEKTHISSQPPYRLSHVERSAIEQQLSRSLEAWGYAEPRGMATKMIHTVIPIRYDASPNAEFQETLKRRVAEYLKTQKHGAKATSFMWAKVVFYIVAYFGTVAELTLVRHSLAVTVALIVLLSVLSLGLAYNVAHDAVHGALSKKRWVNEVLFYVPFNIFGPNAYLWRYRHTVMHHSAVNVPGFDFNIEATDILRFSPTQKWRPMHRYQHLYAPFAYLIFTFHWVFVKDFKMLILERIGNVAEIKHPWWRFVEIVLWKLLHVGMLIILPIVALDYTVWQVLGGYLLYQLLASFQFVLTFTGSHLNEGMVFVEPGSDHTIPHSFLEHALRTSLDFHPTDPFLSFWLGGFNAHVAHHMFPHICSVHYPSISRIIEKTAAEFGMPYKQISIDKLFFRHFAYLKQLGHDAESPHAAYMLRRSETDP